MPVWALQKHFPLDLPWLSPAGSSARMDGLRERRGGICSANTSWLPQLKTSVRPSLGQKGQRKAMCLVLLWSKCSRKYFTCCFTSGESGERYNFQARKVSRSKPQLS